MMTTGDTVLEFRIKELVPSGTSIHQADDGTLFFYEYQNSQRLYVKHKSTEEEIDLKLPDGNEMTDISAKIVHGNSIYFLQQGKIYKADYSLDNGFVASFVRDQIEGETITFAGVCSRVQKGRKSVYRLCDDPEKDAIILALTPEKLEMMELRGVHKGKAIYLNSRSNREPSARHLSSNVVVIDCLTGSSVFMRDSSRLIYLTNQDCVFALDPETALFQFPFLSCGRVKCLDMHNFQYPIRSIVAVHDDVITVRGRMNDMECLMTAQLPSRYFETPAQESIKLI